MNKTNVKPRQVAIREESLGTFGRWAVHPGKLKRSIGNPGRTKRLFTAFAEKLPKAALSQTCSHLSGLLGRTKLCGVYIAHDSMGYPRYIGRGTIRTRLQARFRAEPEALVYFSFYVVEDKMHEREIETLLIHAAGQLLDLNYQKISLGIHTARVHDFEPGTFYYERRAATRKQLKDSVV